LNESSFIRKRPLYSAYRCAGTLAALQALSFALALDKIDVTDKLGAIPSSKSSLAVWGCRRFTQHNDI
jgi:hypothetical protein